MPQNQVVFVTPARWKQMYEASASAVEEVFLMDCIENHCSTLKSLQVQFCVVLPTTLGQDDVPLHSLLIRTGLRPNKQTRKHEKLCVLCSSQPRVHRHPSSSSSPRFSKLLSLDKVLKSNSRDIFFGQTLVCQTIEYRVI